MLLVLKSTEAPPGKQTWANSNRQTRGYWSWIYEAITNWFCKSNGFRKNHKALLIINNVYIYLDGEFLRYLSPNLRSIASLLYRAYINYKDTNTIRESTPGIYTSNHIAWDFEQPYYRISYNKNSVINSLDNKGTIFSFNSSYELKKLNVPGSNIVQAIIWINQILI